MPFIDCNQLTVFPEKQYDYTIIGAGVIGILLGVKLSKLGHSVQIVETGHFSEDEARQTLNLVEYSAKPVDTVEWGRKRAVGGTSIAWGGQSLPFTKLDFKKRSWIEHSGWPIQIDELTPYYQEANAFMKVDEFDYQEEMLQKLGLKDPGAAQYGLNYHVSKWAKQPNFVKLYKSELENSIAVYYNGQVTRVNRNGSSKTVDGLEVSNFNGQTFFCPVRRLLIAAGGVESVRLLLLNELSDSDWVGKCFMEHPCIEVGDVITSKPFEFQKAFNTHLYKGNKYSLRLSLAEEQQQKEHLSNCSASIMFKRLDEATFDPYAELKSFLRDFSLKRALRLSSSLPDFARTFYALVSKGFFYKPGSAAKLTLMTEQEPMLESAISLGSSRDLFNQKVVNINWSIGPLTWRSVVSTALAVQKMLEELGLAKVQLYPHVRFDQKDYEHYLTGVNHHMGGARMGSSNTDSVVDKNLRLWDWSNVYVCSSSVFPTSSHSNPTLTLMALACRLVNHLEPIS